VVVSPDVDSKIASVKLMLLSGSIKNGIDPKSAKIIQNRATIRKPSCKRISEESPLEGSQKAKPTISVKKKEAIKEDAVKTSLSSAETMNGITIEKLNTIISIPNVLKTDL
jgi:hypothetical protein|tara:strand:- start:494 stop:826 length:333 start_codon:yes stop_codon:yes gene_type:complete